VEEWRDVWRACDRVAFGMRPPGAADRYGKGGSVQRLEARVAELLGKEAALFFPGGTMCNLVAIKVHTRPGDAVVADARRDVAPGTRVRAIPVAKGL